MSCNSCAKPYSLLRKEKGCPSCGFSFCSKCLDSKAFVQKLNSEEKVCRKCKVAAESKEAKATALAPPDAYYKRMDILRDKLSNDAENKQNDEILNRLLKLKEDTVNAKQKPENIQDIDQRLKKLKGEMPSTSDQELQERLRRLRGYPTTSTKTMLPKVDLRTDQQKADDILNQYMAQTKIDADYKNEFDGLVNNIESRLSKLKGSEPSTTKISDSENVIESEDEEEAIKRIVEKVKAEASLDVNDEIPPSTDDELPFCEICNEDARMRCLGCRYLFCNRCYLEHKDDDDGCNKYELYKPPKIKN